MTTMLHPPPVVLSVDSTAIGDAQRHVAELLDDQQKPVLERALLLTSELVAYGLHHRRGIITLDAWRDLGMLRVTMHDDTVTPLDLRARTPYQRDPGLASVRSLSSAWGIGPGPQGRGINWWFEISVPDVARMRATGPSPRNG